MTKQQTDLLKWELKRARRSLEDKINGKSQRLNKLKDSYSNEIKSYIGKLKKYTSAVYNIKGVI